MEVRRGDALKVGTEQIGARIKVKVVKNKVAPPFRSVEFDMIYGKGISKAGDLLDIATAKNIIGKSGTYFNYGDVRLGQGRDNARTFLEQNPAIFSEIDTKARELFKQDKAAVTAVAATEEEE
jgi:recombination protein RecA